MASKSRAPFHSKIYFPALTVSAILVSTSCFAQSIFLSVASTPYDKQMTRVSVALHTAASPAPNQTPKFALDDWMIQLRLMPYCYSRRWKTPAEVNADNWGDCKAKAVALYQKLMANGASKVWLIIGKHQARDRKTHAWLEWETAQGTFLLDPTFNWKPVRTDDLDKSTYIPSYAFESGHKYRAFDLDLIAARE